MEKRTLIGTKTAASTPTAACVSLQYNMNCTAQEAVIETSDDQVLFEIQNPKRVRYFFESFVLLLANAWVEYSIDSNDGGVVMSSVIVHLSGSNNVAPDFHF